MKTEDDSDNAHTKHTGWDAMLETYMGPVTELTTGVPYHCWNCLELNRPVPAKRHYAVIHGRQVGVGLVMGVGLPCGVTGIGLAGAGMVSEF